MARVAINTGATPNDGTGDNLRAAGGIINDNFLELYTYLGAGSTTTLSAPIWNTTASGINTLRNVGLGTTNPRFALEVGSVGSSGTSLWVNGDARITGILTIGTSSITLDGSTNTINVGSGITINGNTGVISATQIYVGGAEVGSVSAGGTWAVTSAGIHTTKNVGIGTTNPTSKLEVIGGVKVSGIVTSNSQFVIANEGGSTLTRLREGHLHLGSNIYGGNIRLENRNLRFVGEWDGGSDYGDFVFEKRDTFGSTIEVARIRGRTGDIVTNGNLNVSGISTLSSNVSVGGTISIDGGVKLATNNATIVGTSGTAGEIKQIGGAPFYYDGSAWREFVLSSGTPVTVPADTEWDNVVFRATFDTDFTDAKFGATPVFVSAGSTIVGAAVTIGTGAFRNNGAVGSGVSYAYRSDYDFTGSWTIEFWIYHDSTPVTYESLVSQVSTTDDSGDWTFGVYNSGVNIIYYWDNENSAASQLLHAVSVGNFESSYRDQWTHYALVREGDNGSLHFYINGVETSSTIGDVVIDNDILHINGAGLGFGAAFGNSIPVINGNNWNNSYCIDAIFDDVRISCGVGTAGQRYTSIGISTYATFTPPTTALPTTGTLSSYVQPPGDKYGEIGLGTSPTWRGTSGVTVTQQSSGNYRVSFASSYTNANDYYVLSQGMDQGFASYVGIARSTTHVDLSINKQSDDTAVNTGSLAVQIKNHI